MNYPKNAIETASKKGLNLNGLAQLVIENDCKEMAEVLRTIYYDYSRFSYLIEDRGLIVPSEIEVQFHFLREVIEAIEYATKD